VVTPEAAVDPPAPPSRPRGPSWLVAIGAVVLVAAAIAGLAWWLTNGGRSEGARPSPSASRASTTPTSGATSSSAAEAARVVAVDDVLTRMGRAVVTDQRRQFLATIDPRAAAFRAREARVFARLQQIPIYSFSLRYVGTGPALPAARAARLPEGSFIARVDLKYRYDAQSSAVDHDRYLTFVPDGSEWRVASDRDAAGNGLRADPDIWDLGPIDVVHGRRSLVIGAKGADLRAVAADADTAVAQVRSVWTRSWPRHPVVIVPADRREMARLIGSDGRGLSQIAAVTTGNAEEGSGTSGDRVVMNPTAWASLGPIGRQVVLTHEVTHVATRATTVRPVPLWLSEGFADYVAYRPVSLPVSVVAGDALRQVRNGHTPRRLPTSKDFDAAEGRIAPAYEGAWLACRMIAGRYGVHRLVRYYAGLAGSTGGQPGVVLRRVLGLTPRQLVHQWQMYLQAQAGT
jgi:hypothetical protein